MEDRINSVLAFHSKEYGTDPTVVVSCPGRASLMGDFTEYSQGYSLSLPISQRIFVAVSLRNDSQIRFSSREFNEKKKTLPGNLKFRKEDRWANIPKGALALVNPHLGPDSGLDISVVSEIPMSVGLGSSQALAMASVQAYSLVFGLNLSPDAVMHLSWQVETQFLGVPTGLSAFRVMSQAKEGHLQLLDHRTGSVEQCPISLGEAQIYIFNSRVPPSSFESPSPADQKDIDQVVRYLSRGRVGKTLRDFNRMDLRDKVGDIPESSRRRSLHVVEENLRVFDMKTVVQNRDWQTFTRLMSRSHESLRDLYEVSCPEVDWLVKRMTENTCFYGARFSSTGTGGVVMAIGLPQCLEQFKSQLDEYERIFGFKVEALPTSPSQGLLIHLG